MKKELPVFKWLSISALVIIFDQITKWLIVLNLEEFDRIPILPFFNIVRAHNKGAAFSFLSDAGGWQHWLFIGLAIVVSIMIIGMLTEIKSKARRLEGIALSLILGGAIGNVIDRLIHGYVVDFLDVYVGGYHWPAFNVADSAICIGAALFLIYVLSSTKKTITESN